MSVAKSEQAFRCLARFADSPKLSGCAKLTVLLSPRACSVFGASGTPNVASMAEFPPALTVIVRCQGLRFSFSIETWWSPGSTGLWMEYCPYISQRLCQRQGAWISRLRSQAASQVRIRRGVLPVSCQRRVKDPAAPTAPSRSLGPRRSGFPSLNYAQQIPFNAWQPLLPLIASSCCHLFAC